MLSSALCFVMFLFLLLGGGASDVLVGVLSGSEGHSILVVLIGIGLGQILLGLVGLGLGSHGCSLLPDLPESVNLSIDLGLIIVTSGFQEQFW